VSKKQRVRARRREQPITKAQPVIPLLPRPQRWVTPAIFLTLIALTWIVFGQTLGHEFVNFDDHQYVYENPQVARGLTWDGVQWAFTHKLSSNWHPLTLMSHQLDGELFGLAPGGHHFTNVLLHTVTVLLLFGFLRQATGSVWRSAFVTAVFAIHPLRVESVAWVSERKDVLSGVFFMLTLWAYLRYVRLPNPTRYLVVALLFIAGLMSKPMLVTLPLVLLLLDYWPLQRQAPWRRLIVEKIPLFALSAGSALIALLVQSKAISATETLSIWQRAANALLSCLTYVGQSFWPVKLSPFYPHPQDLLTPGPAVLSFVVLAAISAAAVLMGRTRRYLAVGWLWYLIMLVPVLGLVQVGSQAHADRYTYLPQIGLALIAAWGSAELSAKWRYRRVVLGVAAAIVLLALAGRAWRQTAIWHDSERLWRHALAVTKHNHIAHASLARVLWSKNRAAEAIPHFQQALVITPDNVEMHNQVGLGLMQIGKPSEGIAHWKKALQVNPQDLNAQSNLAWVFATCPEPAMRDGQRAVALAENVIARSGSRTPILLRTLGAAYAEAGKFTEAIAVTQEAMQLAIDKGDSDLATALRSQISDYQLGLPLRDSSLAGVQPVDLR
jgi:protein O-mannosyl-transferase